MQYFLVLCPKDSDLDNLAIWLVYNLSAHVISPPSDQVVSMLSYSLISAISLVCTVLS